MIAMKASEIARLVSGTLVGDDVLVTGPVVISSQQATDGSIFAAFEGEKVDGHDYVQDAFARGALLALVSSEVAGRHIAVDNVQEAITTLAQHVREQLTDLKVVAITGSQGKTTTKELTHSILSSHFKVVSPTGNFNNELGVPLTLLQCDSKTEVCIIEMGARHIGDIAHLVDVAKPDIGVVLRVAAAHVGEFGSIERIAQAKSEMISGISDSAIAICGLYDSYTSAMTTLHKGSTFTFGETHEADIRATDVELRGGFAHFDLVTPDGRNTVALRVVGLHQVSNALAASAIAHCLGLSNDQIAAGLSMAESSAKWRMELHHLENLLLINDAYNASPDSMVAALQTMIHFAQERGGESWAFLGTMRELGESSDTEHARIGTLASEMGIDHLVAVGAPQYIPTQGIESATTFHQCATHEEAVELVNHIHGGDVVLCKASRSEKFELLVDEIEKKWQGKAVEE
jgi:UDP-N-acetylmuramoyl-tripeptide--D-alanyl-D-alanine ligase